MLEGESVIAVFGEHAEADHAVKKLMTAGIGLDHLSIVGKEFHSSEKTVGFYNIGEGIKFWGKRGALWGSLWALFIGGVSLTIPDVGGIMVLGYLATIVVSAVEGAVILGGMSVLGAALLSAGVPRASIVQYEQAVKADGFLVIVHGEINKLARARALLAIDNPTRADLHDGLTGSLAGPATPKPTLTVPTSIPGTLPSFLAMGR